MCGIFGFNFEDKALLRGMHEKLKHRGPDDKGFFTDKCISLGHARLSVIDLSEKGRQPLSNEDGTVWITYNGEIYNFKELRAELEKRDHRFSSNTDTEVIVHAYEEYGLDFVNYLRGMFAFAIYDSMERKLILVRDRIGIKPLYYYFNGEKFIFASEIKAILEHIKPRLDKEALKELFTFQFTIAPKTLFEGIKKLPPANVLIFDLDTKNLTMNEYWQLELRIKNRSEGYYIKTIEEAMKESVRLHLVSDVPLGVYLSGGLDSSYITALMSEVSDNVRTFTIGFNHPTDETEYASRVAEEFGTEHREIIVEPEEASILPRVTWHLDTPVVDIAAVPTYIISRATKKHLTVALTGDGGDELFAGYEKYKLMLLREYWKKLPARAVIAGAGSYFLTPEMRNRLPDFSGKDDCQAYLAYASTFSKDERRAMLKNGQFNEREKIDHYFKLKAPMLQKLMYLDLKTLLPDDYLMKVDKTTMANAVEARVPYLDHKFVEFAFSMPPSYKIRKLQTKYIFRKAMARKLPKEIVNRKKHGFNLPTERWLEEGLKEIAIQLFDTATIINRDYAKKILENFERSKRYYNRQFWTVFSFILWHKMYFEKMSFDINTYL